MKKVIFLMLTTLAIISCSDCKICKTESEKEEKREEANVKKKVYVDKWTSLEEVEFEGHLYIIWRGHSKGNIIHAEHCPCKNTKH